MISAAVARSAAGLNAAVVKLWTSCGVITLDLSVTNSKRAASRAPLPPHGLLHPPSQNRVGKTRDEVRHKSFAVELDSGARRVHGACRARKPRNCSGIAIRIAT